MVSFLRSRIVLTALVCAFILCFAQIAHATFGVGFVGEVQTLGTGSVTLSSRSGIVVDLAGDVYLADMVNDQIVEVNAFGVASVLAISGLSPALSLPAATHWRAVALHRSR